MFSNRKGRINGGLVLPLVLLVVVTVYLLEALRTAPPIQYGAISVSFFPIVVSVAMYAALLVVLWQQFRQGAPEPKEPVRFRGPLEVVALSAVYIALFRPLGYALATVLYVYGLLFVFRLGATSHLKRIIIALAITAIFYVLFEEIFQVRLPKFGTII